MEQPVTISRQQLAEAVMGQVGQFPELLDTTYYLVSPEFLDGDFARSFRDLQKLAGVEDWQAEINDCDKCSRMAAMWAGVLHARTVNKFGLVHGGLAMGQWNYKPGWSTTNHSINWFAYAVPVDDTHPDGIAIGFYEPAKRWIVQLSETEINSCFKCAA